MLEAFARRLTEAGIDPETPLEHGARVVEAHAAARQLDLAPWLAAVERHVLALHARSYGLWSPLRFFVGALAAAAGHDAAAFEALLTEARATLFALVDHGVDTTRTEQYGVRCAAAAFVEDPAGLLELLRWARATALRGEQPGWTLQLLVPVLREHRPAEFAQRWQSAKALLASMKDAKHSPGYPVATGLSALAQLDGPWDAWCGTLATLAKAAKREWFYGLFEYGLSGLAQAGLTEADVGRALELGVTLADHGIAPGPTWQRALGSTRSVDLATRLAEEGIEPNVVVTDGLWLFDALGLLGDEGERLLDLARTLRRHGLPLRFFEECPSIVMSMEERVAGLGERTLTLAEHLAENGHEPTVAIAFGLPRAIVWPNAPAWLPARALELADALTQAGLDPYPLLSWAVRPVAELSCGDEARFVETMVQVRALIDTFEALGIPYGDVLFHDVAALAEAGGHSRAFGDLLGRVASLVTLWKERGLDVESLLSRALPAAAREAVGRPWVLAAAFDAAARLARAGHGDEAVQLLAEGVSRARELAGEDEGAFAQAFSTLERWSVALPADLSSRANLAACAIGATNVVAIDAAFAVIDSAFSEVTGNERAALADALPALANLASEAASLRSLIERAHATLCGLDDPARERYVGLLGAAVLVQRCGPTLLEMLGEQARAATVRGAWVVETARRAARAARGDEPGFLRCVEALRTVATREKSNEAFDILADCAATARSAPQFLEIIEMCCLALGTGADATPVLDGLARIRPLLEGRETLWEKLVCPTLRVHRQRSASFLWAYAGFVSRHVPLDGDLDVLREIVTQRGVRSLDCIANLVAPALERGIISSLSAERATLHRYLDEIGFNEPRLYARYQEIEKTSRTEHERRERASSLLAEIDALTASIRSGEVTDTDAAQPLFFIAWQHLFPPAVSAPQHVYEHVWRTFEDRPSDV
ncbi:MAG: hypothetical protein ABI321_09775, partial [Polyangia bacterium]